MPGASGVKHLDVIFATSNMHKVEEAKYVLGPYGLNVISKPIKGIEVQNDDVGEVARFAASNITKKLSKPLFVEDTGLYVDALNGFPGPFSAYVFRTIGNEGLLRLVEKERSAYFESAVALKLGKQVEVFKGRLHGKLSYAARGNNGFGFDPIFIPDGESKTLGEMTLEEKCGISHRSKALRMMADWLGNVLKVM
jgi:XTP/dITP diphosphohydrolase